MCYDAPVIQLDLHATAVAVAGATVKPEWKLEGVNLLPFLSGEQGGAPHAALYWRLGEQMAIRAGDFKLVRYDINADTLTGRRESRRDGSEALQPARRHRGIQRPRRSHARQSEGTAGTMGPMEFVKRQTALGLGSDG